MEWKHSGSLTKKKFKVKPSAGKVMATGFLGYDYCFLIEYLERGHTINANRYCAI